MTEDDTAVDERFQELNRTWDRLGEKDPFWAILSDPEKRQNRWEIESFFATGRLEIEGVLQAVAELSPRVPRRSALDFGCGVGRLTRALAVHFERVIGIDVAASMIRRARQLNADLDNCEFVHNQRTDLRPIESGSVDLVYSNIVLQHIGPPYAERYVREFVRVLSPEGLALFQIPYADGRASARFPLRLLPRPALEVWRRARMGRNRIEMHAIAVERVHAVVREAGGQVVRCEESGAAGRGWKSKLYYVRRAGGRAPVASSA